MTNENATRPVKPNILGVSSLRDHQEEMGKGVTQLQATVTEMQGALAQIMEKIEILES